MVRGGKHMQRRIKKRRMKPVVPCCIGRPGRQHHTKRAATSNGVAPAAGHSSCSGMMAGRSASPGDAKTPMAWRVQPSDALLNALSRLCSESARQP
jgi:hypothetical protein